jgi:membrane protease YdiL (CAAX protease family)
VAVVKDGAVPTAAGPDGDPARWRTLLRFEVLVVLALSFGQSAVYSFVSIIAKLTAKQALNKQAAGLNAPQSPRPWLDFTYQVLDLGFSVAIVALVAYLLLREGASLRTLGFDFTDTARDWARGALVAAGIGSAGLGLYLVAHALNLNATVVPTSMPPSWYRDGILTLDAFRNGVTEEVVVLGYLLRRFDQLGFSPLKADVASSLVRGSYHLYQGFGGFVGNFVMGMIFCRAYRRWGRVMPLVVAHGLIDTVTFLGWIHIVPHLPAGWVPH